MMERRTDLALETRESFPGDGGEVEGVSLSKETVYINDKKDVALEISTVKILDEQGATRMNKPVGSYITIETGDITILNDDDRNEVANELGRQIEVLAGKLKSQKVLVAGLGNRNVTADSLGPIAVDNLQITRHYAMEFGYSFLEKCNMGELCAISPGVMAQTGMEAEEVLHAVADKVKPDVVEAEVIVWDRIEEFMTGQGFNDDEIQQFILNLGEPAIKGMYVTPKNIDETVRQIGEILADSINVLVSYS